MCVLGAHAVSPADTAHATYDRFACMHTGMVRVVPLLRGDA